MFSLPSLCLSREQRGPRDRISSQELLDKKAVLETARSLHLLCAVAPAPGSHLQAEMCWSLCHSPLTPSRPPTAGRLLRRWTCGGQGWVPLCSWRTFFLETNPMPGGQSGSNAWTNG